MLMVTDSIVVIILDSLLLLLSKEVCECRGQQTVSTYLVYCSNKFDREPNAFVKVLTGWIAYENLKTRENTSW